MYLVKTVSKKYKNEALKHGRIRVGTINYYRGIEDAQRQDAEEGLGHVVWKGDVLTAEDHNRIFTPFEGVKLAEGWKISNAGAPLLGSYPNFNLFTFCYSQVKKISQISSTAGGKATDKYFIKDLPQFLKIITPAIRREGERLIRKYEPSRADELIRNLEVLDVTYKVFYSDESKAREVSESNVKAFNPKSFHPQDFFQKRTSFAYEREVRTVWVFIYNHPDGTKEPLQLPPPDLTHIDLELGKLPITRWCIKNEYPIKTSAPKPKGV